jgi:hypothetical protein
MNRIVLLLALFGILLFPYISTAETLASVPSNVSLADINVSDTHVVFQDEQMMRVDFQVTNYGPSPQSDIVYGLEIVRIGSTQKSSIADRFVVDGIESIDAGKTVSKEVTYVIPHFLSGEYDVWVKVRTTGGLLLGLGNAGTVKFSGSGADLVFRSNDCSLMVGSDKAKYSLTQGVDVSPRETLLLECGVENVSGKTLSATPQFLTYRRSVSESETTPTNTQPKIEIPFESGEYRKFPLEIPFPSIPQAYDVAVSFSDSDSNLPISEKMFLHYVLRGTSATIQNVILDKSSYTKGERVNATLYWTPQADAFIGARTNAALVPKTFLATLLVSDAIGVVCVDSVNSQVISSDTNVVLSSVATRDCPSPVAKITLSDTDGNVLDTRLIESPLQQEISHPADPFSRSLPKTLLYVVVLVLFVLSMGILLIRIIMRRRGLHSILFWALCVAGMFAGAPDTSAASWNNNQVYGDRTVLFSNGDLITYPEAFAKTYTNYTANIANPKAEYVAGDTIRINASASIANCGNSHDFRMYASFFPNSWSSANQVTSQASQNLDGTILINVDTSRAQGADENADEVLYIVGCTDIGGVYSWYEWCGRTTIPINIKKIVPERAWDFSSGPMWNTPKGTSVKLNWYAEGATSCIASNNAGLSEWSGSKDAVGSQFVGPLNSLYNYDFFLNCTSPTKGMNKVVHVTTIPSVIIQQNLSYPDDGTSPYLYLSSLASAVYPGGSCSLDPAGTTYTTPITDLLTHTYGATCKNSFGDTSAPATTTIRAVPMLVFDTNMNDIYAGQSAELFWKLVPKPTDVSHIRCKWYDTKEAYEADFTRSWNGGLARYIWTLKNPSTWSGDLLAEGTRAVNILASQQYYLGCSGTYVTEGNTLPFVWANDEIINVISPTSSDKLSLCFSNSGILSPASSQALSKGEHRELRAWYGPIADSCVSPNTDLTSSTAFSDAGASPVSLLGNVLTADQDGAETVTATYVAGGRTFSDSATVTVTTPCGSSYDCQSSNFCQDEAPDAIDGCGVSHPCVGTRQCDFNWKEVVPGF